MGVIGIILLVAFVIICILLVCIVLVQNDAGGGMGGLLGGGNSAAFGSRSGNVLTKTTYILVTLFFTATFVLAFINKAPAIHSLDAAAQEDAASSSPGGFWLDEETDGSTDASGGTEPVAAGAASEPAESVPDAVVAEAVESPSPAE